MVDRARTSTDTTILLVRHATHGHVGKILSGRSEGLSLKPAGRSEAKRVAARLAGHSLAAIHTSPRERARETAALIGEACGCQVEVACALDEINFGEWTGRSFAELEEDPRWREWNTVRSRCAAPGGESMAGAQHRALEHLRGTARRYPGATVALVTHCDIIRAVVAAILGLSLDYILHFEVNPASFSRIAAGEWGEKLVSLNEHSP